MNHRYAQKIVSTPWLKDGLYWPISPGEAPSPLGPAFSPPELVWAITAIGSAFCRIKMALRWLPARKLWSDGGNELCR